MLSHRYTTKLSRIPEHIGGAVAPTPSPEFPKQLEESEKKPVACSTMDNEILGAGSAPAVQQEKQVKLKIPSVELTFGKY